MIIDNKGGKRRLHSGWYCHPTHVCLKFRESHQSYLLNIWKFMLITWDARCKKICLLEWDFFHSAILERYLNQRLDSGLPVWWTSTQQDKWDVYVQLCNCWDSIGAKDKSEVVIGFSSVCWLAKYALGLSACCLKNRGGGGITWNIGIGRHQLIWGPCL